MATKIKAADPYAIDYKVKTDAFVDSEMLKPLY
jgi:hypothetical protein